MCVPSPQTKCLFPSVLRPPRIGPLHTDWVSGRRECGTHSLVLYLVGGRKLPIGLWTFGFEVEFLKPQCSFDGSASFTLLQSSCWPACHHLRLAWGQRLCSQHGSSPGCWLEASAPHHEDLYVGLAACLHDMRVSFPWGERSERESTREATVPFKTWSCTISSRMFYWLGESHWVQPALKERGSMEGRVAEDLWTYFKAWFPKTLSGWTMDELPQWLVLVVAH